MNEAGRVSGAGRGVSGVVRAGSNMPGSDMPCHGFRENFTARELVFLAELNLERTRR